MKLNVSKHRVIETIKNHPESKEYLYSLFPEVEEELEDSLFCNVGDIITKNCNNGSKSVLMVLERERGEFGINNLTTGTRWVNTSPLTLRDRGVTLNQFRKMTGNIDITKFTVFGRFAFADDTIYILSV